MKNTLLVLALAFIAIFSVQAQDSLSVSTSDFKPVAGDKTAEIGFNFDSGVFFYGEELRFRKFTTATQAMRLGIYAYFDNEDNPNNDRTATYGVLSITPGIERHFTGTKRLSPYVGAELPLSYAYSRFEDQTRTIKGAWDEGNHNRAHIGVGLNALAGVDLYLIKNFYVGFEFGAGISYRNYQEIEIDFKEDFFESSTVENKSSIYFNTFTSSGLRLGFVF